MILVNSSLVPIRSNRTDVDELAVPATDIAKELGSIKAANIVALSAFVSRSKVVDFDVLRECVKAEFAGKTRFIPLNMEAMDRGRQAALKITAPVGIRWGSPGGDPHLMTQRR